MIPTLRPLGYWWRQRAARRQEEARRTRRAPQTTRPTGVLPEAKKTLSEAKRIRLTLILAEREDGASLQKIAARSGLSQARISQIYYEAVACRERGLL